MDHDKMHKDFNPKVFAHSPITHSFLGHIPIPQHPVAMEEKGNVYCVLLPSKPVSFSTPVLTKSRKDEILQRVAQIPNLFVRAKHMGKTLWATGPKIWKKELGHFGPLAAILTHFQSNERIAFCVISDL